jgi:hypothetical protein
MDFVGPEPPVSLTKEDMADARSWVNERFIHIHESFVVTSPCDFYNCVSHALGRTTGLIWPSQLDAEWPADIAYSDHISSFTKMLARHGYEPCTSSNIEVGHEKIALYTKDGFVKHAARQMDSGRWTSKLGYKDYDIAHHSLADLEGKCYGHARHFFHKASKPPE